MKKTSKITAVLEQSMATETKEQRKDLIAFGMSIDFAPLFRAISKKLGLAKTLEFSTPRIYERNGNFYVECESVNIVDRVGVFASVVNEVRITFFSTLILKDEERDCHFFWVCVNLTYHCLAGGSNALDFVFAGFDNEKGWTFKFVKPPVKS